MSRNLVSEPLSTAFDGSDRPLFGSHGWHTEIATPRLARHSSQALPVNQLDSNPPQHAGAFTSGMRQTVIGSSGSDTFVLKPDAGTLLIKGFNLNQRDRLELAGGLTFDQITITPETKCNLHNTLIRTQAGELLAILKDVKASTINNSAFLTLTSPGSVTSQGDRVMQADIARERFRVDGTGVKIGILSDSFDNLGRASQDIASGDLPANIGILKDLPGGGTDEGRAMMQLIHDVAPGATLLFHTAFASGTPSNLLEFSRASENVMANGIRSLAAAGAKVIVDDVGLFTEPFFQDGIVAQAIQDVVAQGVAYFTSAGNSDRDSYQSSFRAAGFDPRFGILHDFDGGPGVDPYQSITVPVQSSLTVSFQWDSPLGRSPNDLDIYLLDQFNNKILAQSTTANVGGDPIEVLRFQNDGSSGSNVFNLMIAQREGPTPGLIKYIAINNQTFQINEYNTNSPSLFGHQNSPGVVAVGAVPYFDPTRLESFSSVGGIPILFNSVGDRLLQPQFRLQPKIVAPDQVNITATTKVGQDIQLDPDQFPNFFGTSAAAPQAAAVAALLLQAHPALRPADLYFVLEATALDINSPNTPGSRPGFDFASGYGLIQADRAIAEVAA